MFLAEKDFFFSLFVPDIEVKCAAGRDSLTVTLFKKFHVITTRLMKEKRFFYFPPSVSESL